MTREITRRILIAIGGLFALTAIIICVGILAIGAEDEFGIAAGGIVAAIALFLGWKWLVNWILVYPQRDGGKQ